MIDYEVKRLREGMIRVRAGNKSAVFQAGLGMENILSDALIAAEKSGYKKALDDMSELAKRQPGWSGWNVWNTLQLAAEERAPQ